jgi:hypothetical protein
MKKIRAWFSALWAATDRVPYAVSVTLIAIDLIGFVWLLAPHVFPQHPVATENIPATTLSTDVPKPTPKSQAIHYPPTSESDLHMLAALGDASAIHTVHSETVGLAGVCPEQRREVTVSPTITGEQLAEDLFAYFFSQQLNNPCGSLVLAFHDKSETDNVYTAGSISLDVMDSSGQANIDPNATNLTYSVTLDIGSDLSHQEYTVTYSH